MSIEEQIRQMVQEQVKVEMEAYLANQSVTNYETKEIYTNRDVMEMLQIDTKTLKKYRDDGLLGFSHPYDKYFYTRDDLQKFMMNKAIRNEPFNIKQGRR